MMLLKNPLAGTKEVKSDQKPARGRVFLETLFQDIVLQAGAGSTVNVFPAP
jgi:hypothetical protein